MRSQWSQERAGSKADGPAGRESGRGAGGVLSTRAEVEIDIYAKNEKSDLTPADKRELRTIVSLLEGTQ